MSVKVLSEMPWSLITSAFPLSSAIVRLNKRRNLTTIRKEAKVALICSTTLTLC